MGCKCDPETEAIEADTAVNDTDEDLNHNTQESRMLTDKGGQEYMEILETSREQNRELQAKQFRFTETGGDLKIFKYIIQCHGPHWKDGSNKESEQLNEMVSKMINACNDRGVISVTFPLISTKLYKFPPKESAIAIIKKVITYIYLERPLNPDDDHLLEIHLIHESKDLLDYMAAQIDITQESILSKLS